MRKQFFQTMVLFVLLTLASTLSLSSAQAAPGDFLFEFGRPILVGGMAEDKSGNVYVTDRDNNRIVKFDSSGRFLAQWGSPGSGNCQFQNPAGMASDSSGNIYVADSDNSRIQKFDSSGGYLTQWGSAGSGPGQFQHVQRLAVDSSGNVYVADYGNNRIQKFDSNGGYITQWGSTGTDNGQFMGASSVAVDDSGNVYVLDYTNRRVQKFDSSGGYFAQWKIILPIGNPYTSPPVDIAVDASGNVYVSTDVFGEPVVIKYDNSGTLLKHWYVGRHGYAVGNYLARSGSDSIWTVDTRLVFIRKYLSTGELVSSWNSWIWDRLALTVDSSGNIFVANANSANNVYYPPIQKYDSSGWNIGREGVGPINDAYHGWNPRSVVVDRSGNLFVAVSGSSVQNGKGIQKYSSSGALMTTWSAFGSLAVDAIGHVYVADADNNWIQKFDNSGGLLTQWGSPGSGDGQFQNPGGVAVDNGGNVYVADSGNNRIQKFNSNGGYLSQWGSYGSGIGQLDCPNGIAVDDSGNVYVVDINNKRIEVFTNAGTFIGTLGSGSQDVALDVADNRIYLFSDGIIKLPERTIEGTVIKAYVGYGATHFAVSAPSSATAGSAIPFTVTALDAANNPVIGFTGKVQLSSSDGAAIFPAEATLTNGVGTLSVTLRTAGIQTITASKPTNATVTGVSNSIVVAPAPVADLTITKSHIGNFRQGQIGAIYTIKVTNSGNGATTGTVKVTDTLPSGLTAKAISGTGWACTLATLTCTRSNALAAGASYPQITLKVNVASNAPASVINRAKVSGGGEFDTSNNTASDQTVVTAPSSIWSSSATPGVADAGPDGAVELGVKFRSDVAGTITGIRFYKASSNTGTHTASLWTSTGTRLATATFTGETASGWQQVKFATPVSISANTVYVASYHTNVGHYSDDEYFFAGKGVDAPPLHVLADGVSGFNGVYAYGSNSKFPNRGWNSSNYWVDVIFEPLQ